MNISYFVSKLKNSDYKKIIQYVNQYSDISGKNKYSVYCSVLYCFLRYSTQLDYFYWRFFKPHTDRKSFVSTFDLITFQKKYNVENTHLFNNKITFRQVFKEHFNYSYFILENEKYSDLVIWIKQKQFTKVVAKHPLGLGGTQVCVYSITVKEGHLFLNDMPILEELKKIYLEGFTLFEEFIIQYPTLAELSKSAVNTLRINTFVNKNGEVEFWKTGLRISINKNVDNFGEGGLIAQVDFETGIVCNSPFIKDPFDENNYDNHPVTNVPIVGFQIPFWKEVIEMVKSAALVVPEVRSVGWDVAMTQNGPTLVEGNHNWSYFPFKDVVEGTTKRRIKEGLNYEI